MTIEELRQEIVDLFQSDDELSGSIADAVDCCDNDILTDSDKLRNLVYEAIEEQDGFTNYREAMNYLMENDDTLQTACQKADDMGYSADRLNSCILATCCQQAFMEEAYENLTEQIESLIENYEDEKED